MTAATRDDTTSLAPDDVAAEILRTGILCVDLDGTLAKNDAFADALIVHLGNGPRGISQVLAALCKDRAEAKEQLAKFQPVDGSIVPYNDALIDWLRAWKAKGVRLVLATAADQAVAESVALHLDLFDDVMASDGKHNLKSTAKAEALVAAYGEEGFVYVGDSTADLKVWQRAAAAVAVNSSPKVAATLSTSPVPSMVMTARNPRAEARSFLKAVRPHQWSKNLLVFVPILTSGEYTNTTVWLLALLAFIAFSLTASGVYLINDALDLNSDRQHPRKRNRPFASGKLPIIYSLAVLPILLLGAGFAWAAGISIAILVYIFLTSFYSLYGKRKVILDVVLLALLYSIRLYAGGIATGHTVSAWLLAFSGFLFFNLAIMKRYAELHATSNESLSGRGYLKSDLIFLLTSGMASGFSACVVLALYVEDNLSAGIYDTPALLWTLAPLMLIWQLRLWRETIQGRMTDDPIIFAARDKATMMIGVLATLFVLLAHSNVI